MKEAKLKIIRKENKQFIRVTVGRNIYYSVILIDKHNKRIQIAHQGTPPPEVIDCINNKSRQLLKNLVDE